MNLFNFFATDIDIATCCYHFSLVCCSDSPVRHYYWHSPPAKEFSSVNMPYVSTNTMFFTNDELCCDCREKKHAADQRIAELQALIALANDAPGASSYYGHGFINPFDAYAFTLVFTLAVFILIKPTVLVFVL